MVLPGGDPHDIRALARRVRDEAATVRAEALLVRGGADIAWVSAAADTYRDRLADHAAAFETVAQRFDAAADDLDALAQTLESRQGALLEAWNAAKDAWDDAVDAVEGGARRTWDYAEDLVGFARDRMPW